MIFPEFIRPGDTIGVTAPSRAMEEEAEIRRFRSAEKHLNEKGYKVLFTENVFGKNDRWGRSACAEEKAREYNALINDENIAAVYSASGGDSQAEILRYLDTEGLKRHPKWIQGFSDNTSTLYYLTTKCDIATAYGANFGDFGMENWDRSVENGLKILEGKTKVQESFETFQNGFGIRESGLEGYAADGKVVWKNICGEKDGRVEMRGRLIGGCLDVIMNISGTPYDGTDQFIEKYKDDGIIWFLESFDAQFEQMMEYLWKMKEMGWFKYASGIVFGRPMFYNETGFDGKPLPTYEEVLHERLDELGIPVIMDADVGHKGPQFVMINGAPARIISKGGKGCCTYEF